MDHKLRLIFSYNFYHLIIPKLLKYNELIHFYFLSHIVLLVCLIDLFLIYLYESFPTKVIIFQRREICSMIFDERSMNE